MNNKTVLQDVGPDGLQIGIDQGTYDAIGEWPIGDTPDVQRLQLEPGDTLVVLCDMRLSMPDKDRLGQKFSARFPENQILILDKGIRLAVIGANE